ncbi:hypothetical protein AGMMS49587_05330 [Spirochaetia bacterium]|nr:hypothetical protein AGMMS49587_05330 [Spirochaetia bacterium]
MKIAKKITAAACIALAVLIAAGCGSSPKAAAAPDELDIAIREASDYLDSSVPVGNKIVILNVQSDSDALSDYIIDELIANAVNDRNFAVVDRQQLDAIRSELNFQWAGEVDDNSAQEIGKMVGAQTIVSGAVSKIGDNYRMRTRALEVQTAQVQGQFNRNIPPSETITALMKSSSKKKSSSGGPLTRMSRWLFGTSSDGGSEQTAQAGSSGSSSGGGTQAKAPAAPVGPKSGTYTLWPRPRASKAGQPINVYIAQIVYSDDYTVFYFTRKPEGDFTDGIGGFPPWEPVTTNDKVTLQDLDNPAKFYSPVDGRYTHNGGHTLWSLSFNRLPVKRFKLTSYGEEPKQIFYEIVIPDQPDA